MTITRASRTTSVMNYTYQFGIGVSAAPGPYATSQSDPSVSYRVDYSSFLGGTLHEGSLAGNACTNDGSGGMSDLTGVSGGPGNDTDVIQFYSDFGNTIN